MKVSSEELVQTIFQKCAGTSGCEVCRSHMHEDCLFFPELYRRQDGCSMPLLMEGQKQKAMEKIQANVYRLVQAVRDGYKLVCSCPTCGYFFRKLLLENAYYSDAAQEKMNTESNTMKVPLGSSSGKFISLPKKIYSKILKDDGYFSSINPFDRIELAEAVIDLGEYLLSLHKENKSIFSVKNIQTPLIYFAPCHQREQEIGQPYFEILSSISGLNIIQIGGALDCCGMGGHLGYKASFHRSTLIIASRHLSLMVSAGVLKNRKQGRWIYFRLNKENQVLIPLFGWVNEAIKESKQVEQDLEALKAILCIPCEELNQKQRESGRCSNS